MICGLFTQSGPFIAVRISTINELNFNQFSVISVREPFSCFVYELEPEAIKLAKFWTPTRFCYHAKKVNEIAVSLTRSWKNRQLLCGKTSKTTAYKYDWWVVIPTLRTLFTSSFFLLYSLSVLLIQFGSRSIICNYFIEMHFFFIEHIVKVCDLINETHLRRSKLLVEKTDTEKKNIIALHAHKQNNANAHWVHTSFPFLKINVGELLKKWIELLSREYHSINNMISDCINKLCALTIHYLSAF